MRATDGRLGTAQSEIGRALYDVGRKEGTVGNGGAHRVSSTRSHLDRRNKFDALSYAVVRGNHSNLK